MMGKHGQAWDGLQAQTRYHEARASLSGTAYVVS
jgi:hypothetical protein